MERKIAKEKFYVAKKSIKICDVNVDNVVISKLVKTKTNSKCLIKYLDKAFDNVLIMSKISGYVKTCKVNEGDNDRSNKLVSFRTDNEKLLEKHKAI